MFHGHLLTCKQVAAVRTY